MDLDKGMLAKSSSLKEELKVQFIRASLAQLAGTKIIFQSDDKEELQQMETSAATSSQLLPGDSEDADTEPRVATLDIGESLQENISSAGIEELKATIEIMKLASWKATEQFRVQFTRMTAVLEDIKAQQVESMKAPRREIYSEVQVALAEGHPTTPNSDDWADLLAFHKEAAKEVSNTKARELQAIQVEKT